MRLENLHNDVNQTNIQIYILLISFSLEMREKNDDFKIFYSDAVGWQIYVNLNLLNSDLFFVVHRMNQKYVKVDIHFRMNLSCD